MSQTIATTTFRHQKKEGTYLYMADQLTWDKLPEALQQAFPQSHLVVSFEMSADKKLARADGARVYAALKEQGFYVQMPPSDPVAAQALEEEWVAKRQAELAQTSAKA